VAGYSGYPQSRRGEKMKHTDTPWKEDLEACVNEIKLVGANGDYVCTIETEGNFDEPSGINNSANAEFIVRCCNSHDELVKALRDLLYLFDVGNMENEPDEPEQVRAKKVLVNAEKTP